MPTHDIDPPGVLDSFADASASAVDDLKTNVSIDAIHAAARMIGAARSIAVVGLNAAIPVAGHMEAELNRRGFHCRHLHSVNRMAVEHVLNMGANDVLIAISLTDRACPVMKVVSVARDRRVPVLGITASATNPLCSHSKLHFAVPSEERYDVQPLAPYIVLIESLLVALVEERKRRVNRAG